MRQIHRDQKQRTTKKKRWRRKKRQNSKTMKTTKKCVLQVKTVQQPSHMPLIWKCQLKAHITFLTASTGGIFSLSDTRWALCFKKLLQIEREGGGGGVPESSLSPNPSSWHAWSPFTDTDSALLFVWIKNPHLPVVQSLSCAFIGQKETSRQVLLACWVGESGEQHSDGKWTG